jgi:NitT/TauT family transport system permease protein
MVEGKDAQTGFDPPASAAAVAEAGRAVTELEADSVGVTRGRAKQRRAFPSWLASLGIVLAVFVLWEIGSTLEWWSSVILPPLNDVIAAVPDTIGSDSFGSAFTATLSEIIGSFIAALVIGFSLGALFWKVPYIGRVCEPYLVSFYAVPFVVFYPVMVVLIGLNRWPIILLAATMGTIPMALNTWIGLAGVPNVYWKLAASLQCSRRQTLFRIAIPAAGPIVLAGVRLAGIYALIGSVSMEFLLAPEGLGYEVRKHYELFDQPVMMVYVLVVFAIATVVAFSIAAVEGKILGKRAQS